MIFFLGEHVTIEWYYTLNLTFLLVFFIILCYIFGFFKKIVVYISYMKFVLVIVHGYIYFLTNEREMNWFRLYIKKNKNNEGIQL